MAKNNFQEIKDLGFTGLIDKFSKYTGVNRDEIKTGIGDDASVFLNRKGTAVATSSEIFLEGVHFDLAYTPFHHLGYKIITAAVSDIYAMNAEPVQVLLNVAIPNRYSVQMMEQLYRGADAACKDYNVQLSGGDTTASHQILAISVTAAGQAEQREFIYRNGGKRDNLICVTGDLGGAIAGLRVLLREKKAWQESGENHFQPDLEKYEYVVQRQLVPKARKDFAELLGRGEIRPTAMIDVTQGLIADVRSLAKLSGLGAEIYSPAVPISLETRKVADEMEEDVDKYAFYGGEDFEMLFTIDEPLVEKLAADFDDFSVIGKLTDQKGKLKINTGEEETIEIDL